MGLVGMVPQIHCTFPVSESDREKNIDRMHFATSAYNDDDAVPLPLGLDFQDFVQIFIDENSPNKYDKASKVIEQLQ